MKAYRYHPSKKFMGVSKYIKIVYGNAWYTEGYRLSTKRSRIAKISCGSFIPNSTQAINPLMKHLLISLKYFVACTKNAKLE